MNVCTHACRFSVPLKRSRSGHSLQHHHLAKSSVCTWWLRSRTNGMKVDCRETWGGIQRDESTERKMYNDQRCYGYGFWTVLVTCAVLQRRLRIASLVMHHKCITIWECSLHMLQRIEIWAPHKEEYVL